MYNLLLDMMALTPEFSGFMVSVIVVAAFGCLLVFALIVAAVIIILILKKKKKKEGLEQNSIAENLNEDDVL